MYKYLHIKGKFQDVWYRYMYLHWGCHGLDRMLVGFKITFAISTYHH